MRVCFNADLRRVGDGPKSGDGDASKNHAAVQGEKLRTVASRTDNGTVRMVLEGGEGPMRFEDFIATAGGDSARDMLPRALLSLTIPRLQYG